MFTSTLGKLRGTKIARGAVLAAAAAVGVSAGILAADDPGSDPATEPVEAARASVAFTACPGGAPTGAFHGGDRVLATARSDDGAWIEVRSPDEADGSVAWVPAAAVEPDASFEHLPTSGCEVVDPLDQRTDVVAKGPTPTTTTLPAPPPVDEDRADAEPDQSDPATDEADDGGTDESQPEPATDEPATDDPADDDAADEADDDAADEDDNGADEVEPEIGAVAADPGAIWEDGPVCDGKPRTAAVSAEISDDTAVASARLVWSVADEHGEVAMERSGTTWSATVGPFAEDTIPYATSESVVLTVEATDEAGNTSSTRAEESTVELHDCTFG